MDLLIIDNFDSFTYNLVQQLLKVAQKLHSEPLRHLVVRNDQIITDDIIKFAPTHVILSPGPGDSSAGGVSKELLSNHPMLCPILGVCLGMQLMISSCGGKITPAPYPIHGHQEAIKHTGTSIFQNVKMNPLKVARYHSLIAEPSSLPASCLPLAHASDGALMAFRHTQYPWFGVQFHPESFLTEEGDTLIENFLSKRF